MDPIHLHLSAWNKCYLFLCEMQHQFFCWIIMYHEWIYVSIWMITLAHQLFYLGLRSINNKVNWLGVSQKPINNMNPLCYNKLIILVLSLLLTLIVINVCCEVITSLEMYIAFTNHYSHLLNDVKWIIFFRENQNNLYIRKIFICIFDLNNETYSCWC